ncbi:MAG TPA: ribonuclease domain-containing protein [Burkholderiales bacterium]|nr:ribonuclease domain-containing protein [Burkholderiales bacterium]
MRSIRSYLLAGAIVALAAMVAAPVALARDRGASASGIQEVELARLPREARETLAAIKRGGPFAFERDGVLFGNYERHLPSRERGYYREYTVPTPGQRSRGARRIVAGGAAEYYYSDDHYRSFRRIRE